MYENTLSCERVLVWYVFSEGALVADEVRFSFA